MCGIVGYIGKRQAADLLVEGLSKLEYRGYDSAGVAIIEDEKISVAREWLRPSQGPPGVLKFSSGKLKLKAKCSNYEYLAF